MNSKYIPVTYIHTCICTHEDTRENPYPCTWVRVFMGMGTDRVKTTHGLPMSHTTAFSLVISAFSLIVFHFSASFNTMKTSV